MIDIVENLFAFRDEGYRDFQSRLIPTVDKDKIIGVRTPQLRKLAKEMSDEDAIKFMATLPHRYYEEDNLHAFLVEKIKDFDECVSELDRFLPYVDNWATCDSMTPRVLKKHSDKLLLHIDRWMLSGKCYTVRYGIGLLMKFYLDENYSRELMQKVAQVKSEEYYVRMMVAWYFATALAKHYDDTVSYIQKGTLDEWTYRKTIQKACESLRLSPEQKKCLRELKSI